MLNLKLLPRPIANRSPDRAPVPRRWLPTRLCRWFVLAFLALVAVEAGLRTHDWLRLGLPFFWDPVRTTAHRPRVSNGFLVTRAPAGDWHSRGKTPDQVIDPAGRRVIRIVCLGSSTTWDEHARKEAGVSYPAELQRLLNAGIQSDQERVVEVINAGFPDFTTLHALILFQSELLALKPDVLVLYGNLDDVVVNYFPDADRPAYGGRLLHKAELPRELQRPPRHTVLDHSRLYQWVRDGLQQTVWFRMKYRSEDDGPVPLTQINEYRRHLESLIGVAHTHGVKVVIASQAFAADPALFEKHFRRKAFTAELTYPRIHEFARHVEEYNNATRAVARSQGAEFIDVAAALKDRKELFHDVVHTTPEGSRAVARCFLEIGEFLPFGALSLPRPERENEGGGRTFAF